MDIVLTNAGIALLQAQGGAVVVDKVVLGTGFGYTPSPTDTNIHGSPVTDVVPNIPLALNGNLYEYSALFDYQSGPYTFGEAGYFVGNTLFALAVATQSITKNQGTYLRLDAYLQVQGQNYELWINAVPSNNQFRLAVLQSPDQLPNPKDAWPNAYIIQAGGSYDSSLAYTDRGRLWSFAAWRPAGNLTVQSATTTSVTVKRADLTEDMTPTYFGSIISQMSSGKDVGTVRIVESLVISGDSATFNFATPFTVAPSQNDTIIIYVRAIEDTGSGYQLPPATTTTLGGVKVGNGLSVTEDGLLNALVTSVAGRTGNVEIKVDDVVGLATVAKTGAYSDLSGKPGPYVLPIATTVSLGGVKVGNTLTIASDGTLDAKSYNLQPATTSTLGGVKIGTNINVTADGTISVDPSAVAMVKTVDGQAPDPNGNINIIAQDPNIGASTLSLINDSGQTTGVILMKKVVSADNNSMLTIQSLSVDAQGNPQQGAENLLKFGIKPGSVVTKINGQSPDTLGNVPVVLKDQDTSTGTSLLGTDVLALRRLVAGSGISITPDSVGNLSLAASIAGLVKTVNGQTPDANGNVDVAPFNNQGVGVPVIVSSSTNGKPQLAKVNAATSDISVQQDASANISIGIVKGSVVKKVNGISPDQSGNLTLNPTIPGLRFEFGNSGQPNSGYGIDKGTYWQADANSGGWLPFGGMTWTPQADGSFVVPQGVYLITIGAKILVPDPGDNYALPAQMVAACNTTLVYGFPGVFQEGMQVFPNYQTVAASASGPTYVGSIGFVTGSGTANFGTQPGFIGYSKILGTKNNLALLLQGYCTLFKIG